MPKLSDIADLGSVIWEHPANRGRKLHALANSVLWQLDKRLVARPRDVAIFENLKLKCYPDSHEASRVIYFNGWPDPIEMTFIERYLRPGDKVIDAGANVGIYTLLAAKLVGAPGKVIAIEPDAISAGRLKENVANNHLASVTIINGAIADYVGTAEFTLGSDTGNRFSSLGKASAPKQSVAVTTLDRIIAGEDFALCKMDVEGAEFSALKGCAASIARGTPAAWLMELTDRTLSRAGTSVAEVRDWLSGHDIDLWQYVPESNRLEAWELKPRRPGQVGDAIAITRRALGMVKERLGSSQTSLSPASS